MKKLVHLLFLLLLTIIFFPPSIALPKDMNSQLYRNSLVGEKLGEGYELGTRVSFNVPDHVPNVCDECQKAHGNCGVGLRCICHPKDCKDKVISASVSTEPRPSFVSSLVSSILLIAIFKGT